MRSPRARPARQGERAHRSTQSRSSSRLTRAGCESHDAGVQRHPAPHAFGAARLAVPTRDPAPWSPRRRPSPPCRQHRPLAARRPAPWPPIPRHAPPRPARVRQPLQPPRPAAHSSTSRIRTLRPAARLSRAKLLSLYCQALLPQFRAQAAADTTLDLLSGPNASTARISGFGCPSARRGWMQTWVAPAFSCASMRSRM